MRGESRPRTRSAPHSNSKHHHHHTTSSRQATKTQDNSREAHTDTTPTPLEKALFTEILPNDVPTEWEETRQQVIKTMRMRWADSTRQARNRLYDELMEEATLAPQIALQTTAAIMIEKKKVTIQTKLTYAKNLHTVLRSLNNDVTIRSCCCCCCRVRMRAARI